MGRVTVELRVEPDYGATGGREGRYGRMRRRGVEDGVNASGGHTISTSEDDEVRARTLPSDGKFKAAIHNIWRPEDKHDGVLADTSVAERDFMYSSDGASLSNRTTWPWTWSAS